MYTDGEHLRSGLSSMKLSCYWIHGLGAQPIGTFLYNLISAVGAWLLGVRGRERANSGESPKVVFLLSFQSVHARLERENLLLR